MYRGATTEFPVAFCQQLAEVIFTRLLDQTCGMAALALEEIGEELRF